LSISKPTPGIENFRKRGHDACLGKAGQPMWEKTVPSSSESIAERVPSTRSACDPRSLTEAAASDMRSRLEMKNFMQTRTVAILAVTLAITISLSTGPLVAQPSEASPSHQTANEVYSPSVTPAIYLENFLLLYMANPDLAAYMPAN
jgi:hypothetical protein